METINICIEGYWRDLNKKGLPTYPGIFIVYQSRYDEEAKVIRLKRILYIGEAHNIRDEIEKGKIQERCRPHLKENEELSYSAGSLSFDQMTAVKAALVFRFQPEVNKEFKAEYLGESLKILISGRTVLLEPSITVNQFEKK